MRGKDDEDAGRRRHSSYRPRRPRGARNIGELAARLAPLEERMPARAGGDATGPDGTIRVKAEHPKPAGGPLDEEEEERGVFYMPPVVTVAVSLFLAYTLFVAVLIAVG